MCGIVGVFNPYGFGNIDIEADITKMRDTLIHRGPDDAGIWIDLEAGIALGHRRLAILELTQAGHQPMLSRTGRYLIVFNGEIYNHLVIRNQLPVRQWKGLSDTETLLAGIEIWGLTETLKKCSGMFSIALWDRQHKTLSLARDRLGEKPLYFGWQGSSLVFASELKAFRLFCGFKGELNEGAIISFLQTSYISAPETIWKGIFKLLPGSVIRFSEKDISCIPDVELYWSLKDVVKSGIDNPFLGDDAAAIDALDKHLSSSVKEQMISDVSLGAFLSGGIDSSLIVALMQKSSTKKINTFSIGFDVKNYNEAPYAKKIAEYLGTSHTEYYVTAKDAQAIIPTLSSVYDEPFADSSQIPTILLTRLARTSVTVALTGEGGDELFAGYSRYAHINEHYMRLKNIPRPVLKFLSMCSKTMLNRSGSVGALRKLERILDSNPIEAMYSVYQMQTQLGLSSINSEIFRSYYLDQQRWPQSNDYISWMMCADIMTYLPDDLMVKIDRAAMYSSMETRAPFLSHELYDFCWSLPFLFKKRAGVSKWLLREVLKKYMPSHLFERKKMGFALPIGGWLMTDLRDWADSFLNKDSLREIAVLDADNVMSAWSMHKAGKKDMSATIWNILMLQSWFYNNKSPITIKGF